MCPCNDRASEANTSRELEFCDVNVPLKQLGWGISRGFPTIDFSKRELWGAPFLVILVGVTTTLDRPMVAARSLASM